MTTISRPFNTFLVAVITGNGRMLPLLRMSVISSRSSSVIGSPVGSPVLSVTPTST